MNYVILHYFSMAYLLCNIQVSAIFKKLNHTHEIDDFISQLLSSRKFDELTDILADKTANKILHIQATKDIVKRFKARQDTSEGTIRNREINEKNLKKELPKVYPKEAVIKSTIPSGNVNLDYKYMTVKEPKTNLGTRPTDHKKAESIKLDRYNKTDTRILKERATEKNHAKKITIKDKRGNSSKHNNHKYLSSKKHRDVRDTSFSGDDLSRNGNKRTSKRQGRSSERSYSNESQNEDILPRAQRGRNVKKNDDKRQFFSYSEEMEGRNSGTAQLRVQEDLDNNNVTSESFYNPYGQFEKSSFNNRRFRDQFEDTTNRRNNYRSNKRDWNGHIRPPDYKDYHEDVLMRRKVHAENVK